MHAIRNTKSAVNAAVSAFSESIRLGASLGADLILIETMNDAYETKAAVLAAKEGCDLPVFVTNVYDASGKLMTGADPETMTALLEGLGCDAIGMNCSLGPDLALPVIREFAEITDIPLIFKPNAGLPITAADGTAAADYDADTFVREVKPALEFVDYIGGCCGCGPEYIRRLKVCMDEMKG